MLIDYSALVGDVMKSDDIKDAINNDDADLYMKVRKNNEISNQDDLERAARSGKHSIIKAFHSIGYDIHRKEGAAIKEAAMNGQTETVALLIDLGASKDNINEALISSARDGHTETVDFLLSKGADVQTQNNAPLCFATMKGHSEVVKSLMLKGANPHYKNDRPFMLAVVYELSDIINTFLFDFNMPISKETKAWLEKGKYKDVLDILSKRDLAVKLNSSLKQKNDKTIKMKI